MNDTVAALPLATPESCGIASSAIDAFLDALEQGPANPHGFVLVRHGAIVAQGWWRPYDATQRLVLYSLSKSFAATAAGLAIGEGRFTLDDPVVSFFPERVEESMSDHLAAMRVRDLLTMATGHDSEPSLDRSNVADWARAFLSHPVPHAPGTHFLYNSAATYMVSAIVQRTTGERLSDYLRPRLFDPLGIGDAPWERCPSGVDVGGWGLRLTTDDIARFGELYLRDGVWRGQRLLPEGWVAQASAVQVSNGDPLTGSDWNQGYGFQFWRCVPAGAFRGDGAYGQYCVVCPEQDAVVAIHSGATDMPCVLSQIWEILLPAMGDAPLSDSPEAVAALRRRCDQLVVAAPSAAASGPRTDGRTYRFAENELGLSSLAVDGDVLTIQDATGNHRIPFRPDAWQGDEASFLTQFVWPAMVPGGRWRIAARGGWETPSRLAVRLCLAETPFAPILRVDFTDDSASVLLDGPVGFGPAQRGPALGTAA
jgi:CubicO group peptidase (beta-lactamase class C family)